MTLIEMLKIFLVPWGWPFLAYVVLQVYVPYRTQGTVLFWLSLLPLLGAPIILWFTYEADRMESNLWPIALIFGGAGLAGYEVLLLRLSFPRSKSDAPQFRQFRSQILALGVFWIFIGILALLVFFVGGVVPPFIVVVPGTQDYVDETVAIIVTSATFIGLGVLVCLKYRWALYVSLVIGYASLLAQLLSFYFIAVIVLVFVILQTHRVLGWAKRGNSEIG